MARLMKHRITPLLAALALLFLPAAAFAACSSPAGNAGDMMYNSGSHVPQYCNGTTWIAMGPQGTGGGGSNTVFITSTLYAGNMGSVAAANADCAARATAAGLSGTYLAWIAVTTGTDDPATTFTQSTFPYQQVTGTVIASNWAGLTSGTLTNALQKNEYGSFVAGGIKVWTNVATNGTAVVSGNQSTANCSAWTSNGVSPHLGYYGITGSTTATWTDSTSIGCNNTNRLICVQQDGGSSGCTSPTGVEGDLIYNSAYHLYQFCGGASWIAMGPNGAGGSCTSPAGNEADIIYNSGFSVMQYCNGKWVGMGY